MLTHSKSVNIVNQHLNNLWWRWQRDRQPISVPCSTLHISGEKWAHYWREIVSFTYLLGFGGDIIPYHLKFSFCCCRVFFKVLDCEKIARQVRQKATLIKWSSNIQQNLTVLITLLMRQPLTCPISWLSLQTLPHPKARSVVHPLAPGLMVLVSKGQPYDIV